MAILKHLTNKSGNYGKALDYLIFQHNEFTQKPILDSNGNMQLREEYHLDGLNCQPLTFAKECEMLNNQYHKNQKKDEIKAHHYIISFDPEDAKTGLTGEKAQQIGIEFAREFFGGHQTLVCTHTDGHNRSGNIHVHIIINSLRKYATEHKDFMDRDYDSRSGYKHHQTRKYLTAMQEGLMSICEREHLHQVDLLSPASDKVSDREYRTKDRENKRFDNTKSNYQTEKDYLRDAIREIASYAQSPEEFGAELKKYYNISFKISRGRFSYLHPDRQKYMTGRTLGSDYTEDYLLPLFSGNKQLGRTKAENISQSGGKKESIIADDFVRKQQAPEYDPSYDYNADPVAAFHFHTKLRLVVDLQTCAKAQASRAYARKVKLSNLQQMAKTICYVQEHHYGSVEQLHQEQEATAAIIEKLSSSIEKTTAQIDSSSSNLSDSNNKTPDREQLLHVRQTLQTNRSNLRKYLKELQIVTSNIETILRDEQPSRNQNISKAQDRS